MISRINELTKKTEGSLKRLVELQDKIFKFMNNVNQEKKVKIAYELNDEIKYAKETLADLHRMKNEISKST